MTEHLTRPRVGRGRIAATAFAVVGVACLLALAARPASAQGGLNQAPNERRVCSKTLLNKCVLWKTIRWCDSNRLNLRFTLQGYRCLACGAAGQPACDSGTDCNAGTLKVLGQCVACGGEGQVACAGGACTDARTRNVLGFCRPCGSLGETVCLSGAACEPWTKPIGIGSAAVCRPCGGVLQPACLSGPTCQTGLTHFGGLFDGFCAPGSCGGHNELKCDTDPPCQPRHQPLTDIGPDEGGFGLCFACGGLDQPFCRTLDPGCDRPFRKNILGFCVDDPPPFGEPTCDCTVVPAATTEGDPVWGFADLHAHQFANLGFGGAQFSGAPFDPHGITFALPACGYTVDFPTFNLANAPTTPVPLLGVPIHGDRHRFDPLGLAAGNPLLLPHFGVTPPGVIDFASFVGWPRWDSPDHQRMYYRWLERAWRGGQRLMIMQAVNNEVSCRASVKRADTSGGSPFSFGCDDMPAVDRQIQAAKDLEAFIDMRHGGPGEGWYRIVYSAAEARQAIQSGKMAVILGIEVDSLFNCRTGSCTEAFVDRELQRYYDLGVRHAYPIHLFDNDFGGASFYFRPFNLGNRLINGQFFQPYDCSAQEYEFRSLASDALDPLGNLLQAVLGIEDPPVSGNAADCNVRGLTSLGKYLIGRMMDKKMIIDLDHMSFRAVDAALDIAEERQYPVIASHMYPADLHSGADKGERKWTVGQIGRLRDLGGIAAPILIPESTNQHTRGGVPVVENDCPSSSKEWAQRYLRTVELMSGGPDITGVGFGSDFNGMTQAVAPRFGFDACGGLLKGSGQEKEVIYPFAAHPGLGGTFDRSVTGPREFDYNVDGLAHVGLLPDFIQDLKNVGLTNTDLVPLFRSAEAFVRMWERIDVRGTAPPTTAATVTPVPNEAGWNRTDVQVALQASPAPDGAPVDHIAYHAFGATNVGPVHVPESSEVVHITEPGTTTLTFYAVDTAERQAPNRSVDIRIDRDPPDVSAAITPEPNEAGWHRGPVTVTFTALDLVSGVEACDAPVVLRDENVDQSAAGVCVDLAGNISAALEVSGISIDLTPPALSVPGPIQVDRPVDGLPRSAPPIAAFLSSASATDALDPAPEVSHDAPEVFPLGLTVVTFTATDAAGNTDTRTTSVEVLDRTPPTTSATLLPEANGNGWHNVAVGVVLSAADEPGGSGMADIVYSLAGAAVGNDVAAGATAAITIEAEGVTTLSYFARDKAGNEEAPRQLTIRLDQTAPLLTPPGRLRLDVPPDGLPRSADSIQAFLAGAVATDALDAGPVVGNDAPEVFPLGLSVVTFTATDVAGNIATALAEVVLKHTPTIEWTEPAPMVYRTLLGDAQLAASVSVPGTLVYTPAPGTRLNAGEHELHVAYEPDDPNRYNPTAGQVGLTVLKATPAIVWPDPAGILYGTPLDGTQLNASADTEGSFAYTPAAATVLPAGAHTLAAAFTPADQANFHGASADVALGVAPAPLTIAARDKTMVLNGTLPEFDVSYAGFVNGDTPASLDTPAAAATAATGTAVGAFPIDVSGATAANYSVTFVPGELSVLYATAPCLGSAGHEILAPVAADGTSVFRGNRTVPAKFRVCDARGLSVGTAGVVADFRRIGMMAGTTPTAVSELVESTSAHDTFRWDAQAAQWVFNMATTGLASNATHLFRITLNDGSAIDFQFGLR